MVEIFLFIEREEFAFWQRLIMDDLQIYGNNNAIISTISTITRKILKIAAFALFASILPLRMTSKTSRTIILIPRHIFMNILILCRVVMLMAINAAKARIIPPDMAIHA